jgi:hypothetical protein
MFYLVSPSKCAVEVCDIYVLLTQLMLNCLISAHVVVFAFPSLEYSSTFPVPRAKCFHVELVLRVGGGGLAALS